MNSLHPIRFILLTAILFSCGESENPRVDFGLDYQPLETGLYWEYEVSQTLVFGENDSEVSAFFLRDRVDYSYINAEGEIVYVLVREVSEDRSSWLPTGNYAMQHIRNTLIRNFENKMTVSLVFPPELGKSWDSEVLNSQNQDIFKIDFMGTILVGEQSLPRSLKVLHEEEDDEITFRNNRYEVFSKGIGLVEQYHEVFTYCSRNDCLGQMIIDSGRLTHLKIVAYGKF
ncbi:hypothetical protein [Aquiflexum sp.]|uniref:hypothetical protein n=1 Tax=Aquiflexum sp. TaxID=1872584 RepID=UPI0035934933